MGLKLLTRSRLGLGHLNERRFNINFESYINPLCSCSFEIELTTYLLMHCYHFLNMRSTVSNSISEVLDSNTNLRNCILVKVLLFGNQNYTQVENSYTVTQLMPLLSVDSKRFAGPLL